MVANAVILKLFLLFEKNSYINYEINEIFVKNFCIIVDGKESQLYNPIRKYHYANELKRG